jgi:site-specific DNA recombinase
VTPCVIYAAKSTKDPKGSIPTQFDDGRKLAAARGLTVAGEFADENESAYHGDRGDGLAKALAECERLRAEHGSCALIVQRSDRLARGDGREARSLVEIVLWAIKQDVELLSVLDPEILAGGDMALLMGAIGHMKGHGESKVKSESIKRGIKNRKGRGESVGWAKYGYRIQDRARVVVPDKAAVVRRIFTDYVNGVSMKPLARALNAEGVPTATGKGKWGQGAISRVLEAVVYMGKIELDDGTLIDGKHEAIVSEDLWRRAETVRKARNQRGGGRNADGAHLLVRGTLRCVCGAAMIPRKARPGMERERYVCSARVGDPTTPGSHSSFRRERIDKPFLAHALDRYIDLEATKQRIADRASAAVEAANAAIAERERELASAEAMLARVRQDYREGCLPADLWAEERSELEPAVEAAKRALDQARAHSQKIAQSGPVGDAEQELLNLMGRLKRAVGDGIGAAPDLNALRNVIGELFDSVEIVAKDDGSYALRPVLRAYRLPGRPKCWDWEAIGRRQPLPLETLSPTGQETPSPPEQSYPPTFLARYCW